MAGRLGATKFEYTNAGDSDSFFDDDFDDWNNDATDLDDLLEAGDLDNGYNMNIAAPSYQQGAGTSSGYNKPSAVPSRNVMPKRLDRSFYEADPSSSWKKWLKYLLVFAVLMVILMPSSNNTDDENKSVVNSDDYAHNAANSHNSHVESTSTSSPTASPTEKGTLFPIDKVTAHDNDTDSPTASPTIEDADDITSPPTAPDISDETNEPTQSPIIAAVSEPTPDLSNCRDLEDWIVFCGSGRR